MLTEKFSHGILQFFLCFKMHTRLRASPTKFCHSVKSRAVRTPVSLPHPIRPMQLLLFAQALEILSYNQYHMSRNVRNRIFAYAKTKTQISFAVTAKLISAFVFATQIVQSLYFLNTKFQASIHLMRLYSPVSVGPGRKPRGPVFSR